MRSTGVLLLALAVAASGCHKPVHNNMPPGEMMANPGPGVGGPGPGVLAYAPAAPQVAASSQIYFFVTNRVFSKKHFCLSVTPPPTR